MPRANKAIIIPTETEEHTPTTEWSEEDLIPIAPLSDVQNIVEYEPDDYAFYLWSQQLQHFNEVHTTESFPDFMEMNF